MQSLLKINAVFRLTSLLTKIKTKPSAFQLIFPYFIVLFVSIGNPKYIT